MAFHLLTFCRMFWHPVRLHQSRFNPSSWRQSFAAAPTALARAALCWSLGALLATTAAQAQVPKEQLLVPPPDAQRFVILSTAGEHGSAARWRLPDGRIAVRESVLLRGQVWELEETVRLGRNGQPEEIAVRGITPTGDAAETFSVSDGQARWKTQIDAGSAAYDGKAQYWPAGGAWAGSTLWAEWLYKAPGRRLPLLPGGEGRLQKLVDVQVGKGRTARTITSWALEGISNEPATVLLNADGTAFGWVGVMALLPAAYTGDYAKIRKAEIDALAQRNPAIAKRFGSVAAGPVAFTHVKLFDALAGRFVDDQTVVAQAGKIVAVGNAAGVPLPAGARVIDGSGKTLLPGLWDAHMHVGSDLQGVMLLSMGATSARDPGADLQAMQLRQSRIARGELLFPKVYSSRLIDGKGPLAAQGGAVVSSADEAVAAVRQAKADGFTGTKFYTSMQPEWLLPAIAEAHRLGLHVHGHIPATMRPTDVIAAGYDEITHINFVMMQAMPDSVVNIANGIARFEGPGRYAKDVDLAGEPMQSLIALMARNKITVDPTLATFEGLYVPDNGDLSPSYAAFVGTMPPLTERGFRQGGFKTPEGVSRADFRASFAKMVALTKALHDAGVPIVAGTDGYGLELVRELELYVQAGMSAAHALQTATIAPARLVGADATTGSITVGKTADLVLVDGDPTQRMGDVRKTVWVMSAGRLMNADELRAVAGFSGRPR